MGSRTSALGTALALSALLVFSACDSLGTDSTVETGIAVQPGSKLRHAQLLPEPGLSKSGADSVQLILSYNPMYEAERVVRTYRVFRRYRVIRRYEFKNVLDGEAITVAPAVLQALLDSLESDPAVAWVEPDFDVPVVEVNSAFWWHTGQKKSWGVEEVGADRSAFRSGDQEDAGGVPDVDLYVLDSGADSPDLNVVECLEMKGQAFEPCAAPDDPFGHGTAVAGIAAARDNGMGLVGTAPGAPVHILRTLNRAGFSNESRMIAAIDLITHRKLANPSRPVVANLSFGSYVGSTAYTALDDAVQAALDAGVTVVVSAGNDGRDASLYSPAHIPGAITVGAYGANQTRAWFSNTGAVIDLFAPGDQLEVLFAGSDPNKMMRESGTSFAAPHVAGAAVVVLAQNPSWTPQQVRDYLVQVAASGTVVQGVPNGTTTRALFMAMQGSED